MCDTLPAPPLPPLLPFTGYRNATRSNLCQFYYPGTVLLLSITATVI